MILIFRKSFLLIILLFGIYTSLHGQSEKSQIYQAFISGSMSKWETVMNTFATKAYLSDPQKLELINFYYGYVAYQIGIGNKDEAKSYLQKGEGLIDALLETNTQNANLYAYKGAFIGFKIGISPIKAPFIGKSSIQNVDKAIALDPNNIQANIEKANVLYYSPSAFGGNKSEAKEYYLKAVSLLEANHLTNQNWLYLSVMTALGKIYMTEGKYTLAKEMYEKILSVEPAYSYVKDELYPMALKKNK